MMRSLYSGVAGLKTHQTKMDVIGNNIANVNTTAYKSSSVTFSDLMSQTTQKASGANPRTGTGGVNARQIGLGVKAGAINVNITGQGSAQSTGNPFDIMINGENFFVVYNGKENLFTRDGSFYVDGAGNLAMTSTGYNVMGWQVDEETGDIKQDKVAALRIMSTANLTYPPEATSKAYIAGILDKNDTDVTSSNGKTVNLNFYDNLGYSYTARLIFKQSEKDNEYSLEFSKLLDSEGNDYIEKMRQSGIDVPEDFLSQVFGDGTARTQAKPTTVSLADGYSWDASGNLLAAGTVIVEKGTGGYKLPGVDDSESEAIDLIAKAYGYEGSTDDFLNLRIDDPASTTTPPETVTIGSVVTAGTVDTVVGSGVDSSGRDFYGYNVVFDPDNGDMDSVNGVKTNLTATLNFPILGEGFTNFSEITIDLSEIAMYDNKGTSTVGATSGDQDGLGTGRRLGDMIGVSVQNNGRIYASYDNGMTKLLGQIATAQFANASGLEKKGDNLYKDTLNSGTFDGVGVEVTSGGGYMSTGQLEMSNVDLSSEFTEMITTQRGFQANSRIITVSDTLLEELTNLKR